MKIFTKLGSCWQSPPHHSSTVYGFEQENDLNQTPKRRISSSAHWRPALTAISEDNLVVVDERRKTKERERTRKAAIRARRVKRSYSRSDADSSWRVQAQIALPAFAPAPFMF